MQVLVMRALTLTQPWAGLVAAGIKPDENRKRPMIRREDFGTPFAIHAGREVDERIYNRIAEIDPSCDICMVSADAAWVRLSRITSAVIAVATVERAAQPFDGWLVDLHTGERICAAAERRWAFGKVVYMLRDVRALPAPVRCRRGHQSFWTLPDDEASAVIAQLARAA